MPDLNMFIEYNKWAADSDEVGYAQDDRWNLPSVPQDGEWAGDCSSLQITALRYAGVDMGDASYTGNMADVLEAAGFVRQDNDGNPQPGDILLSVGNHVAGMVDNGELCQASIDENGNIAGGRSGDQTGEEVNRRPYYDFPWDGYWRLPEWSNGGSPDSGSTEFDRRDGFSGSGVRYQVMTQEDGWLPEVDKADDTDDGYAGNKDRSIYGLKAVNDDGSDLTLIGHVCGQPEDQWLSPCMNNTTPEGDGMCGDPDAGPLDCFKVAGASARGGVAGQGYFPAVVNGIASDGDDYVGEFGKPLVDVQMWKS